MREKERVRETERERKKEREREREALRLSRVRRFFGSQCAAILGEWNEK